MSLFELFKPKPTAPADDLPLAFAKLMAALEVPDYPALRTAADALLQRPDLPQGSRPNVLRLRARARVEISDYAAAVADYTALLADGLASVNEDLRAETLAYFGVALYQTGQVAAAHARFDEAATLAPDDPEIAALRARCNENG